MKESADEHFLAMNLGEFPLNSFGNLIKFYDRTKQQLLEVSKECHIIPNQVEDLRETSLSNESNQ